jgi:hypothetical protein
MIPNQRELKRIHRVFQGGLALVECAGLLAIAFATTHAMVEEIGTRSRRGG